MVVHNAPGRAKREQVIVGGASPWRRGSPGRRYAGGPPLRAVRLAGLIAVLASFAAALAESWNGHHWRILASPPVPAGTQFVELDGVSCTSLRACTAVGYYRSAKRWLPLAETWNGTRWSLQPTLSPSPGDQLYAVSCTTARACTAVGLGAGPLVESWNGTRWTPVATPNPAGTHESSLAGVSCNAPAPALRWAASTSS